MYEFKLGEIMLWLDIQVVGLFEVDVDMKSILQCLGKVKVFGFDFKYKLELFEDKDWECEWMDNFYLMQFGECLWICLSCCDVFDFDVVNVMLDLGFVFGIGIYFIMVFCLCWLDGIDMVGKIVVDFGCGLGILVLVVLKLGVECVVGIDIDF